MSAITEEYDKLNEEYLDLQSTSQRLWDEGDAGGAAETKRDAENLIDDMDELLEEMTEAERAWYVS